MNELIASISRVRERRVIAALTVLAAALRLFHLGAQSLWVDEILTLTVATPKPGYPLVQLLLHNIHGPLHTFVVAMVRMISENDAPPTTSFRCRQSRARLETGSKPY